MEERFERYWPDMEVFHHKARTRLCFVCEVVAGTNDRPQHIVHEGDEAKAFLDSYPRAYGYTQEQQGAWAGWSKGVLDIPQEEMASLAARIGARVG